MHLAVGRSRDASQHGHVGVGGDERGTTAHQIHHVQFLVVFGGHDREQCAVRTAPRKLGQAPGRREWNGGDVARWAGGITGTQCQRVKTSPLYVP